MSASLIVVVLGGFFVVAGIAALLVVIGSGRLAGPDTDQRDPYRLADRIANPYPLRSNIGPDAPPIDLDLALARATGVVPYDGWLDDDDTLTDADVAGELAECYGIWPGAAMWDAEPTVPPIIPGRDTTP